MYKCRVYYIFSQVEYENNRWYNLNRCNWTIALVQEYIQNKFNANMCHSEVYVAISRLNLSYTRPTYGKNPGMKTIETLDYITGMLYCEEH